VLRPVDIMLIEDNPADVRLTQEALKEASVRNRLTVATDGAQAMAMLRHETPYGSCPRPDFILLDLNLPRKDGRQVLAEIKADERLRQIPVVVLTTSQATEDVLQSYDLQAAGFITKPVDLDEFLAVIAGIDRFWFSIVTLPPSTPGDPPPIA